MELPKLYAPVNITFWGLRNSLGDGYGVIFDIDTEVSRKCRRVATPDGWQWQICGADKIAEWDGSVESDEISLNICPLDFELTALKGGE